MFRLTSFMLMLLFPVIVLPQAKEYRLVDKTPSAAVHHNVYGQLFRDSRPASLNRSPFLPVRGPHIVYRFIAGWQGISFTGLQKEFHDVLLVETNKQNIIIKAYQYTLEWTDDPAADLYISSCRNTLLTDGMLIEAFRFKRKPDYKGEKNNLDEEGMVRMGN